MRPVVRAILQDPPLFRRYLLRRPGLARAVNTWSERANTNFFLHPDQLLTYITGPNHDKGWDGNLAANLYPWADTLTGEEMAALPHGWGLPTEVGLPTSPLLPIDEAQRDLIRARLDEWLNQQPEAHEGPPPTLQRYYALMGEPSAAPATTTFAATAPTPDAAGPSTTPTPTPGAAPTPGSAAPAPEYTRDEEVEGLMNLMGLLDRFQRK